MFNETHEGQTHFCCFARLKEFGDMATCCACEKHVCELLGLVWNACLHPKGKVVMRRHFLFWKKKMFECFDCPAKFPYIWKEILDEVKKE